ncbi:Lsr2 family protein [Streptomyces sp. B-S-A8]|uniref:Lsr2 family protein n=1 Tax=Streptomyces solicavernae TaxID=3043614 RepID=A0ABT6RWJ0_9ACTN|nr:histone-like nucleoid-structuring protein Lsr2 [Streptomyces sp. B-S-A8]MDI3388747.1 Lsr2 family protein [Streptomyces sp. B-S-A8]
MQLPDDYKELASAYGPGRFADYLQLYHPHGNTQYVDLAGPMPARIRSQLQSDYDQGTYPVPYDPRHLFTMGVTDNGEYLFWITEPQDAPDNWRIAVNEARGPRWFTYDGTVTGFLVSVLSGETAVPQFPRGLLEPAPRFVPSPPSAGNSPPLPPPARTSVDTNEIREWGRANGYEVPQRGRIPAAVLRAWEQAHRGDES